MAGVKQKKLVLKSKVQERSIKENDPCSGCDLDCSKCLVSGATVLRQAACNVVKRRSQAITAKLGTKAIKGDLNSTKLLLSLAGPQTEKAGSKKGRLGRSAASDFAAEPPWAEAATDSAETAGFRNSESQQPALAE
jgi:hypothetical protein